MAGTCLDPAYPEGCDCYFCEVAALRAATRELGRGLYQGLATCVSKLIELRK